MKKRVTKVATGMVRVERLFRAVTPEEIKAKKPKLFATRQEIETKGCRLFAKPACQLAKGFVQSIPKKPAVATVTGR